jgi:hypothetical protein
MKEVRNGGQKFVEEDKVVLKNATGPVREMSIIEIPESSESEVPDSFIVKCRAWERDGMVVKEIPIGQLRVINSQA